MKKLTAAMLIITAAFFLGLGGVSKPLMADTSESDKNNRDIYLNIMTVNKPQYEMVKKICGDKHNVQYMFNNSEDIKKYKYDESIINNISNMDLFFYSGVDYESSPISNMIAQLDKSNLGVVNLSRGIRELSFNINGKEVANPYYFLGVNEYKVMLYNTKSAIQEKDPANREFYEENYNKLVKEIDSSKKEFDSNSSDLKKYKFILQNKDLEYFFRSLDLNYTVISKDENLEKFISDKKLKPEDVVLVESDGTKDIKLPKGVKSIKLEVFNDNKEFIEIIQDNMKKIESLVKK